MDYSLLLPHLQPHILLPAILIAAIYYTTIHIIEQQFTDVLIVVSALNAQKLPAVVPNVCLVLCGKQPLATTTEEAEFFPRPRLKKYSHFDSDIAHAILSELEEHGLLRSMVPDPPFWGLDTDGGPFYDYHINKKGRDHLQKMEQTSLFQNSFNPATA